MCNFEKCKEGLHPFREITRTSINSFEEEVVRWCPQCGAIVVDREVDGRLSPGYYMKIKFPNITKEYGYGKETK